MCLAAPRQALVYPKATVARTIKSTLTMQLVGRPSLRALFMNLFASLRTGVTRVGVGDSVLGIFVAG